jgi:hypothetical protein
VPRAYANRPLCGIIEAPGDAVDAVDAVDAEPWSLRSPIDKSTCQCLMGAPSH